MSIIAARIEKEMASFDSNSEKLIILFILNILFKLSALLEAFNAIAKQGGYDNAKSTVDRDVSFKCHVIVECAASATSVCYGFL